MPDEENPPQRPGILDRPNTAHSGESTPTNPPDSSQAGVSDGEPFELVGNEIRAKIIQALGEFDADQGTTSIISFSDLTARVDVDVVSSQFNYHLQRLVGHYVEKTEDGYRLRPEGKNLYRTIRAGTFTVGGSLGRVNLDQACYYCDEELYLAYDDGMFTVQCHGCETLYDLILAPPSAIRTEDSLLIRVSQYNYQMRQAFAQGVCPDCVNSLDTQLLTPDETGFGDIVRRTLYVYRSCSYCGNHSYLSLGSVLLHHPAVIAFCYRHDLNVMATPRWELEFAATDRTVSIVSRDPWEASLKISLDDETIEVVIGPNAQVIETTVSGTTGN